MSPGILALVLLAAVLHAVWNTLVRTAQDRAGTLGLISLGHVLFGVALAINAPLPAISSWPFIAASTVIHFGYYAMLNRSYRLGDLSLVYPVARGMTPMLVTLGAAIAAGEILPPRTLMGIAAISAGILALSGGFRRATSDYRAFSSALITGVTIAAYSLVDGLGVRESGAPLGYIAWLFIFEIFVFGFVYGGRHRRIGQLPWKVLAIGLAGGAISAGAYGLVIYANALAPLGVVSSLRETSVLFAALIGVVFLHERPWRWRLGAAFVVAGGIVMIAAH